MTGRSRSIGKAVEGARQKLGVSHPLTQRMIGNLIDCYEKMGQQAKADEWRKQLPAKPSGGTP
jgi:hypothetical protein